jgi:release factor glutamine methyltransferase
MKLSELTKKYYQIAKENDKEVLDIKLLILEVLNKTSTSFYLTMNEEVSIEQEARLDELLKEYLKGKPIAYVLGYKYFYGNKFKVNSDVLIPRNETEELVDLVMKEACKLKSEKLTLLDIGCGCGNIGITIKLVLPSYQVYLSDISEPALTVAKENAQSLNADVEFILGDLLEPFIKQKIKTDIIVSNPPYISKYEIIDASVHKYEPHLALYTTENGLGCYIRILKDAPTILNDKGLICFEIGYKQKDAIIELINQYLPGCDFIIKKDIYKNDRMVIIYYDKMQLRRE